jgi:hypothetical protein
VGNKTDGASDETFSEDGAISLDLADGARSLDASDGAFSLETLALGANSELG